MYYILDMEKLLQDEILKLKNHFNYINFGQKDSTSYVHKVGIRSHIIFNDNDADCINNKILLLRLDTELYLKKLEEENTLGYYTNNILSLDFELYERKTLGFDIECKLTYQSLKNKPSKNKDRTISLRISEELYQGLRINMLQFNFSNLSDFVREFLTQMLPKPKEIDQKSEGFFFL
jgi:hypothetical protein